MKTHYDAIVIGGGILGCMTARNLRRWNIEILLLEKEEDVCRGITKANSAIVYAGYDNKPGSLKAKLTVRGNQNMETLCRELDVPFTRCGSLLVTYQEGAVSILQRKLENGVRSGVPGLRLLSGQEAETMEPTLKKGVAAALYAPSTGTVNPWKLGIAALENALHNGAEALMNQEVREIQREADHFLVKTQAEAYSCKMVFNCGGISADIIQEMVGDSSVRLKLDGADYLVFDTLTQKPERVIFLQAESCGKGITAIPCVEGNLLISGIRKPVDVPFATIAEGLEEVYTATADLLPEVPMQNVIRSFGAVRPNPYRASGESIPDFCIENPVPGFYSLMGIKTPGLTCANELGLLLANRAADYLGAGKNPDFDPNRKAISQRDYEIICQCEQISRAEILEAIARGARSVEGVKRRVGSGMGRCQGSRCAYAIEKLLEEAGYGTV